jgi:hypothetical protein
MACLKFYKKQKRRREIERACKSKPEMRQKRMKRKYQRSVESSQKKAKLSYGKDALVVEPDYDSAVLKDRCQSFYEQNVVATPAKMKYVEESSRLQSESGVWHAERRVRLTASNFGRIFTRQRKNKLAPLIKSVIHSPFKGNANTRYGLAQENNTVFEYELQQVSKRVNVKVKRCGLVIHPEHPFLAATPDVIVTCNGVDIGLIEVENVRISVKLLVTKDSVWNLLMITFS